MGEPLVVTWSRRGYILDAPAPFREGGIEPMMVLSRCTDLLAVWFCESCRCNLANQGQLEMHLDRGGTHVIAVWCSKHRVYEEAQAPTDLQVGVALCE